MVMHVREDCDHSSDAISATKMCLSVDGMLSTRRMLSVDTDDCQNAIDGGMVCSVCLQVLIGNTPVHLGWSILSKVLHSLPDRCAHCACFIGS